MTRQDSCTTAGISQIPTTTYREATINEKVQCSMDLFTFLQICACLDDGQRAFGLQLLVQKKYSDSSILVHFHHFNVTIHTK